MIDEAKAFEQRLKDTRTTGAVVVENGISFYCYVQGRSSYDALRLFNTFAHQLREAARVNSDSNIVALCEEVIALIGSPMEDLHDRHH